MSEQIFKSGDMVNLVDETGTHSRQIDHVTTTGLIVIKGERTKFRQDGSATNNLGRARIEQLVQDRTKHDPDVASYLDDLRAREELRQHKHDPLDTPLDVKIQAFTIERLRRYIAAEEERFGRSQAVNIDELVNDIFKDWLYGEGE